MAVRIRPRAEVNLMDREFEFTLVVRGVDLTTPGVEDALFEAGCDDATLSMMYGSLLMDFCRAAGSLKEAILSAIRDVCNAGIGAEVVQVDECNLVTQSEIARRIGKSRQLVHQFITGVRGPGRFPPPACHLAEDAPMWEWCAVTYWLCENDMIKSEQYYDSEVVAAINVILFLRQHQHRHSDLMKELTEAISQLPCTNGRAG